MDNMNVGSRLTSRLTVRHTTVYSVAMCCHMWPHSCVACVCCHILPHVASLLRCTHSMLPHSCVSCHTLCLTPALHTQPCAVLPCVRPCSPSALRWWWHFVPGRPGIGGRTNRAARVSWNVDAQVHVHTHCRYRACPCQRMISSSR